MMGDVLAINTDYGFGRSMIGSILNSLARLGGRSAEVLMTCPYCGCECDRSAVGEHARDCSGYGENAQDGPDEPPDA